MQYEPTPDQQAFIKLAISSGRYQRPEEAVYEAMSHWEENERTRIELMASFDEAEADLDVGEYADYTDEALSLLAVELKQEARAGRDANILS